ncbi:MAG TPA: TIGR04282 family arsenosugar biosynthesis glycosyltransferase [Chloroflexia bacterium]|nr:TIGR04282 family arsenosugar biosynthesis glycosyltransferase [Chloroflexia bacterium]
MGGLLIIMAKQPGLGTVKTRLSPPLKPQQCLVLYEAFLRDTIRLVDRACEIAGDVTPALAYAPAGSRAFFRGVVPRHFVLLPQTGGDLGERLSNLPSQAGRSGYSEVAMISSDSPTLPSGVAAHCFTELRQNGADVALGPCDDGGYYLIGMTRPQPALFQGIAWSTEQVTRQTLEAAAEARLRVSLLASWPDVDTIESLNAMWTGLQDDRESAPHTHDALAAMNLRMTA